MFLHNNKSTTIKEFYLLYNRILIGQVPITSGSLLIDLYVCMTKTNISLLSFFLKECIWNEVAVAL